MIIHIFEKQMKLHYFIRKEMLDENYWIKQQLASGVERSEVVFDLGYFVFHFRK